MVLILAVLLSQAADGAPGRRHEAQAALDELARATEFQNEAVGYEKAMSPNVRAFRIILQQQDATAMFAELLQRGTVVGRLYALCGLYLKDPQQYRRGLAAFKPSGEDVPFSIGCIGGTRRPEQLLFHIKSGVY